MPGVCFPSWKPFWTVSTPAFAWTICRKLTRSGPLHHPLAVPFHRPLVAKSQKSDNFCEGFAEERLRQKFHPIQATIQPSSAIKKMATECNTKPEKAQAAKFSKTLEISNPHCAGLDLHKDTIWA